MTVRNAVAEVEKPGVGALVEKYKGDFSLVLPPHINADQWVRVAQGVLRREPKTAKVALANPGSLLSALLRCAHLGLEPGDTFHLVPFGNEIVGITDYTGEIELMYRTGTVAKVEAQVVKDLDIFRVSVEDITSELVLRRLAEVGEKRATMEQMEILRTLIDERYRHAKTQRAVREMLEAEAAMGLVTS